MSYKRKVFSYLQKENQATFGQKTENNPIIESDPLKIA